ncbi:MAG: DNA polymerase III subunit beta [Epsilonproteobacteria bacterium]|nr:DNA polymerase III subunit beta [Campylobacterota bacterium]
MKIEINKQLLESILIDLQSFLDKKDATQIKSHVYIHAIDGIITLKATDSEIGLVIRSSNVNIIQNGITTANGKKLLDIIKILKNDTISLEVENDILTINQNTSKFKLPTFEHINYPSFPQINNKAKLSIDSLNLIKAFKKISPAIDSNNPKFELNGALLNINANGCDIVGTDTKRLALMHLNQTGSQELKLIIPKKAIIEIQKLFTDAIDIYYDDTNLIIQNQNYFFFNRLINGKYPDYARIIPKNKKYSFKLPKKEMIESIKMITSICQDITMVFSPNSIIFKSFSNDIDEAKTELLINLELEDSFKLNVNSRYFLDFIMQVDSENFEIILNEQSLPFLLQDGAFQTVIMPIIG